MSSDKEILALEDKRYAAMCDGDFAALEAMLHEELLYTHSSGLTDTKATWLASLRSCEIEPRTRRWKKCVTLLDSKSPIQGSWCRFRREARARERHRHWSWWIA
jgi:hypothetical protein